MRRFIIFLCLLVAGCSREPSIGELYKNNTTGQRVRIAGAGVGREVGKSIGPEWNRLIESVSAENFNVIAPAGFPDSTESSIMYIDSSLIPCGGQMIGQLHTPPDSLCKKIDAYIYSVGDFQKAFTKVE